MSSEGMEATEEEMLDSFADEDAILDDDGADDMDDDGADDMDF
jgi:hypothetical protein